MGCACALISSKMEDVIPIKMVNTVEDACHGKYEAANIVLYEKKILSTLGFRLLPENAY